MEDPARSRITSSNASLANSDVYSTNWISFALSSKTPLLDRLCITNTSLTKIVE